jgi:hypothetical protein
VAGPEDWDYLQKPRDIGLRWVWRARDLRAIVSWITRKQPLVGPWRRRLAEEQAKGQQNYPDLEKEAYRHIGLDAQSRPDSTEGNATA